MGNKRKEIKESQLAGFKYFKIVNKMLHRLHDAGCQRDIAGNRILHMDQFVSLLLLYMFNPICTSLRALQQASDASPEAAEVWTEPLQRLAETQRRPPPPEALITMLTNNNWSDRFVARHTLVALGQEAVYPLQAITTQNETPLKHTADWLLKNIGE